jgi:heptosyltransferase-2
LLGFLKKADILRKMSFDKVYSLHRSFRTSLLLFAAKIPIRIGFSDASLSFLYTKQLDRISGVHSVIRNLSILSDQAQDELDNTELKLYAPGKEHLSADMSKEISKLSKSFVVLAPGSAWKTKQWQLNGYYEVAKFFINQGLSVVLVGGSNDIEKCRVISKDLNVIDFSGKISLIETMYLVKHCGLLICNDSMALHIGSAFKTPTIAVFCATSPSFGFGPWKNPNAIVIEDTKLECRPCRSHGSMKCPNKTNKCMALSSAKVIEASRTLIKQ